jgi:biotin carboxyl carrier protein
MSKLIFSCGKESKLVQVNDDSTFQIDEKKYYFELLDANKDFFLINLNNKIFEVFVQRNGLNNYFIDNNGLKFNIELTTYLEHRAKEISMHSDEYKRESEIKAPMPGLILKVNKSKGEKVQKGESVLILEAMKMENDLKAGENGIVKDIFVNEGVTVEKGVRLFSIVKHE